MTTVAASFSSFQRRVSRAGSAGKVNVQRNGFVEAISTGTGLLAIHRSLQRIVSAGTVKQYRTPASLTSDYSQPILYGFFDYLDQEDSPVGEDISFCRRFRASKGRIYVLVTDEIVHVGNIRVPGVYLNKLKRGAI